MKKTLIILGGVFSFLILLAVVGFLVLLYIGHDLDRESKFYVDQTVPIILGSWDVNELLNRASPELISVAPVEKITPLFHLFSERLGSLKEYKGSKGEAGISVKTGQGKLTTANYIVEAVFEKAPATIEIRLILHGDQWQFLSFKVNSNALFLE